MRITVNTVDQGSGSVLLNTSNYRLNVRDCQDSVQLHRHGAHLPLSWRGAGAVVANLRTSLTGISTVSFCISAYTSKPVHYVVPTFSLLDYDLDSLDAIGIKPMLPIRAESLASRVTRTVAAAWLLQLHMLEPFATRLVSGLAPRLSCLVSRSSFNDCPAPLF